MPTLLPLHTPRARHELVLDPPMTDAELERFIHVNEPARIERWGKERILMMAPAGGDISSSNLEIGVQLQDWWRTHRRGRAFDSSGGFYLPDGSLLSPDASYLTGESFARLAPADRKGYYRICPEFIIELRSESDRLGELKKKMLRWVANGVQLGWLIDPRKRHVLVYKPGSAEPIVFPGQVLEGEGPVAGFRLDLHEVWAYYSSIG